MAQSAKRIDKAREGIDRVKLYPLDEAVKLVKERANAKFDETVEIAMNLGVDPKHADQMVRGVVKLPNGTGRTVRVASSPAAPRPTKPRRPAPTWSAPRTWSTDGAGRHDRLRSLHRHAGHDAASSAVSARCWARAA